MFRMDIPESTTIKMVFSEGKSYARRDCWAPAPLDTVEIAFVSEVAVLAGMPTVIELVVALLWQPWRSPGGLTQGRNSYDTSSD